MTSDKKKGLSDWARSDMGKIGISVILAILCGAIFGEKINFLQPIGDVFIKLLKMIVMPLVLFTMASSIANFGDYKSLGRVGLKTMIVFMMTTVIAILLGLFVSLWAHPGVGMNLEAAATAVKKAATVPPVSAMIVGMFPSNPFASLSNFDAIGVIIFAIFLGIAAAGVGEKGKLTRDVLDSLAEVMYRLTAIVIFFAPYGFFCIIAVVVGKYGLNILVQYAKLLAIVYGMGIFHMVVIQSGLVANLMGRMNFFTFWKGSMEAVIFSWVSDSSAATLPVTMRCGEEKLGINRKITRIVLPLGMTINMDGTALYQGVAAIFIANAYGIELTTFHYLMIVITATLASIGTVGIPSGGFIMMTMVITGVGLPMEGLALIAGVEPLLSRFRTCPNIFGDIATAVYVAHSEGYKLEPKLESV
jgi:Na+/H+-dicarboxylate symporter